MQLHLKEKASTEKGEEGAADHPSVPVAPALLQGVAAGSVVIVHVPSNMRRAALHFAMPRLP
eukprot:scaffold58977_cov21-Tisochrysis_lutea.AAC.2